jgi:hypothetical protein
MEVNIGESAVAAGKCEIGGLCGGVCVIALLGLHCIFL